MLHQLLVTACAAGDHISLSYVNANYHTVSLTASVCYVLCCYVWLSQSHPTEIIIIVVVVVVVVIIVIIIIK